MEYARKRPLEPEKECDRYGERRQYENRRPRHGYRPGGRPGRLSGTKGAAGESRRAGTHDQPARADAAEPAQAGDRPGHGQHEHPGHGHRCVSPAGAASEPRRTAKPPQSFFESAAGPAAADPAANESVYESAAASAKPAAPAAADSPAAGQAAANLWRRHPCFLRKPAEQSIGRQKESAPAHHRRGGGAAPGRRRSGRPVRRRKLELLLRLFLRAGLHAQ